MEQNNSELLAKSDPEETIREHTDKLCMCADRLYDIYHLEERIYFLLKMACEYHDYGKANPSFQKRIRNGGRFDSDREIPHNLLSIYFVDKSQFEIEDDYYTVLYAVLHHHSNSLASISDIIRNKKNLLEETIRQMGCSEILRSTFNKIDKCAIKESTVKVKGLLHRCDYAASAGIDVEYKNDFLNTCLEELLNKWKSKKISTSWNKLQMFCRENQEDNIIVTAPTGMGKTEAALLWIGNSKGIYILPLRTAINSIFHRIQKDILNYKNIETRLALLHSDNISYLITNDEKFGNEDDDMDLLCYRTKAKQFALPLTISTPDQLFSFVFKTAGYESKLATSAYSKVVIDEIQAYDATLLAYVIHGIQQIIQMGGKVAILTATLPRFVQDYITEDGRYQFQVQDFSNDIIRHNIQSFKQCLTIEPIIDMYKKNRQLKRSNKILVICNTVKKAQEIYDELMYSEISSEEINILHAKFTKGDRRRLEDEITSDGATYEEDGITLHNKNVIWITTSVAEASLDIDFDYLFTELSDINGLFQRIGRVNRKGIKSYEEPNCFVYTIIYPEIINHDGTQGFIDATMYQLSCDALQCINGIISEKEKANIINQYFTTEKMQGSNFCEVYKNTKKYLKRLEPQDLLNCDVNDKFRNIISYPIIPQIVYETHQEEIDEKLEILCMRSNKNMDEDTRKEFWEAKQKAKSKILDCTVDVGYYEVFAKKGVIRDVKSISPRERIYVIECNYDRKGFSRVNLSDNQNKVDYGVFI